MNITFEWNTGKIEMPLENIIYISAAKLKALLKAAEENRAEVVKTISEYLQSLIDELNPDSALDKQRIENYEKLLSAIGAKRKLTKLEKAIDRIIKNCNHEQFSGAMYENGKQFFLDGYRLVRFSAPLDFKQASGTFEAEKTIGDIARYNTSLVLPDLKDLKKSITLAKHGVESDHIHIKKTGRHKDYLYDFGYGLPLVNALYLVDMLEALPECEAFCIGTAAGISLSAPIYFKAGADDGILLPIRKTEEYETAPTAESVVTEIVAISSAVTAAVVSAPVPVPADSDSVQGAGYTGHEKKHGMTRKSDTARFYSPDSVIMISVFPHILTAYKRKLKTTSINPAVCGPYIGYYIDISHGYTLPNITQSINNHLLLSFSHSASARGAPPH